MSLCVVLLLVLQAAAPAVSPILAAAGPTPAAPPDPPEVLAPAPPPEPEASPVAPETSPAEPEASPEPLLSAHLALEPAIARPNDVVTATLAVTNTGDLTAAHLVAAADLPLDLRTPIDGRQLQIPLRDLPPGASLQESFQLQVAGLPARPIELVLTISADDPAQPVRAAASLAVLAPSPTRRELGTDGGESLPHGRLQVAFPAGWSAEPAEVTYTAVEWHRIGEGDGVAVGFTLEAVGAISGEPIGRFSRPVTVTLALTGLLDFAGRPSNHLFMRHRAEPDLPWEWVEVSLDREGGVISGALNHFSEIEGGGETAEGWKLLTNLPAVSTFSGAAAYRYSHRGAPRPQRAATLLADPEQKRKIIGATFIDVFDEAAEAAERTKPHAELLAQGTLYPDVIESVSVKGPSATIKSHHNVGGLPDRMKLELVEPLRELFKDEVRAAGAVLGLPREILWRHPFPGPGLAVRMLGPVVREDLAMLREADAIFIDEIRQAGLYDAIWQSIRRLVAGAHGRRSGRLPGPMIGSSHCARSPAKTA